MGAFGLRRWVSNGIYPGTLMELLLITLSIRHKTTYRYRQPVTLGPHQLLLRPREGHDVHIESSRLDISPQPQIKWHRDMFDNSAEAVAKLVEACMKIAPNLGK